MIQHWLSTCVNTHYYNFTNSKIILDTLHTYPKISLLCYQYYDEHIFSVTDLYKILEHIYDKGTHSLLFEDDIESINIILSTRDKINGYNLYKMLMAINTRFHITIF